MEHRILAGRVVLRLYSDISDCKLIKRNGLGLFNFAIKKAYNFTCLIVFNRS